MRGKKPDQQGEERFRRWLIDRIKETRFSLASNNPEVLAARLGVVPEVLVAAQAEKAQELIAIGRQFVGPHWGSKNRRDARMAMWCPDLVLGDLRDRAERMQLKLSEMVRAVVQTLLTGPDNPVLLPAYWLYGGQRYDYDNCGRRTQVSISISQGANTAMRVRAQRLGSTQLALLRGAVTDFLEDRMNGAYLLSYTEMWEDPNRYWTGELLRKGEYRGHQGIVRT